MNQKPDRVLRSLAPIIPSFYRSLEYGTAEADAFFASRNEVHDTNLYPCLVRYYAKLVLASEGHKVKDLNFDALANNGLLVVYGDFRIRILKSDRGDLPVPGHNRSRQVFYWQPGLFGHSLRRLNLVILWDTSSGGLDPLTLVCPERGFETKDSVAAKWKVEIPHPAAITPLAPPSPVTEKESDELPNIQLPHREAEAEDDEGS